MQITMPMTSSAYQVAFTLVPPSTSRTIARHMMKTLARTRIAPSASAARCSAFPWPYWWPGSAGRTATPTAKKVSSAAMRSVPESADAEMRPRLCVARPVPSLSPISASAANTDQRAAFRWASTAGSVRSHPGASARGSTGRASRALPATLPATRSGCDGLRRPDERVLAEGEVAAARCAAQRERHDRGELDLRLRGTEHPAVVVHLGPRVGGEEPVALGQEC